MINHNNIYYNQSNTVSSRNINSFSSVCSSIELPCIQIKTRSISINSTTFAIRKTRTHYNNDYVYINALNSVDNMMVR